MRAHARALSHDLRSPIQVDRAGRICRKCGGICRAGSARAAGKRPPNHAENRRFEPISSHGIAVAPLGPERHASDAEDKVETLPELVTATPREKPQN
jgi:hypothetical protein